MANMGGAGDLAVLGAAKRMGLMAYAQISSRIGGAIILLLARITLVILEDADCVYVVEIHYKLS